MALTPIRALALATVILAIAVAPVAAQRSSRTAPRQVERFGSAYVFATSGGVPGSQYSPKRKDSTLELEWLTITDSTLGIVFKEPTGTRIGSTSDFAPTLELDAKLLALEAISAVEIRAVTFDAWRRFTGVVALSRIVDFAPGQTRGLKREWGGFTPREALEHQTSIVYIARVRKASGEIVIADLAPVLALGQRIEDGLTIQDLEKSLKDSESSGADSTTSASRT